jgi:hypothetical protein
MTEPNLGPLFNAPLPKTELDADAVVRASRRRRLPRFIALGAASLLVVAGAVGGVNLLLPHLTTSTTASAGSHPPAIVPAKGATIHSVGPHLGGLCQTASSIPGDTALCGCGAVTLPPLTNDLAAQVSFPAERAGHDVDGTLTITNNTQNSITATAGTPIAFIVSRGVIVSPLEADDSAAHSIVLAPGASTTIAVPFPGLNCASGDAPAGSYQVAAFVDVTFANGQHLGVVAPNANAAVSN